MFKEGILDAILRGLKKIIPTSVFVFFQPYYHAGLSYGGALLYGFPARSMKVIGVTGTKGKSTTVYLAGKLLEATGHSVATIGSLGFRIKGKEWPNTLKMTMPGRMKLQKFLAQAKKAGCTHVIMEVTSEGIKQKRHLGVQFDCAVFTNLHPEHIESHGSFEAYQVAKQELFRKTTGIHAINIDDPHSKAFGDFPAKRKIFFGIDGGDLRAANVQSDGQMSTFEIYGTKFTLHLGGRFNIYNAMAALAVSVMYGVDLPSAVPVLAAIKEIPGRMQYIQREPFAVVVDYAHTPQSLEAVYKTLRSQKLICVLGAAGGGRDKWKRSEFGKIAAEYCDEIILTDEDPYDEIPEKIIEDIFSGISRVESQTSKVHKVIDRREAIKTALKDANEGDTVVITGKGSETSMALADGKKIPWSDAQMVRELLGKR